MALLSVLACGGKAETDTRPSAFAGAGATNAGGRSAGDGVIPSEQAGGVGRAMNASGGSDEAGGATSVAGAPSSGAPSSGGWSGGSSVGGSDAGAPSSGGSSAGGATVLTRTLIDDPVRPRGFIGATQYRDEGTAAPLYNVEAVFQITRGQWDGCTRVQLGNCWYYDCPPGSAPTLPQAATIDAGSLSLSRSGARPEQRGIGLLFDYWYQLDAAGELWSTPGDTITFSATGSTAGMSPAFSVAVPSPPLVSLQMVDGQAVAPAGTVITRSNGAQLRWVASGPGIARVTIISFLGQQYRAECDFDADAESGSMPAEILEAFEPGVAYRFTLRGFRSVHREVSGWAIDASLAGFTGSFSPFDPPALELR